MLLLLACRTAEVVDWCADTACSTCADDAACAYQGNACTETVYCAPTDASIMVIDIGCSPELEYAWPDPATCRCVDGSCRSD